MADGLRKRKRGHSELKGDLNIFEWNIANFTEAFRKTGNGKMTSPVFVGKSVELPNSFWQIEVYPKDEYGEGKHLGIYLALNKELNTHNPVVKARSYFYLLHRNQKEICSRTDETVDEFGPEEYSCGYGKMIAHSRLFSIISSFGDGVLRIRVKVWIQNEETNSTAFKKPYTDQIHKNASQLLESSKCSDLDIVVEDLTLKAHKKILSCCSPVFDAMFRNEMCESLTNTVKIEDFNSKTVKGMLDFIYSGSVEIFEEDFIELLKIAEKYQLKELKLACAKVAILKLSVETVFELLILGDMYNAPELKFRAMAFINSNRANTMFSLGKENGNLEKLAKEHPMLLLEMYLNVRNNDVDVHHSGKSIEIIEEMTRFTTNVKD